MKFTKDTYYKSESGEVFCYFKDQEIDDSVLEAMSVLKPSEVENALAEYSKKQYEDEAYNLGLEEFRNKVLEQIKNSFNAALNSNTKAVMVGSIGQVNASRESLKDFQDLLRDDLPSYQIRMFDNSFKSVSKEELEAIEKAVRNAGQEMYAKKWQLEQEVSIMNDIPSLLAVKIEF